MCLRQETKQKSVEQGAERKSKIDPIGRAEETKSTKLECQENETVVLSKDKGCRKDKSKIQRRAQE